MDLSFRLEKLISKNQKYLSTRMLVGYDSGDSDDDSPPPPSMSSSSSVPTNTDRGKVNVLPSKSEKNVSQVTSSASACP